MIELKIPEYQNSISLKLPLLILKLLVYSNSMQLTMVYVSLFGFIEGIAKVPKKRLSAVYSLLSYGVSIFQHGLGYTI